MMLRLNEQLHYVYDSAGNLNYRTNNALIENFRGRISPLSRFQLPKLLHKRVLSGHAPDFPPSSRWAVFCVVTASVTVCDGKCDGLSP